MNHHVQYYWSNKNQCVSTAGRVPDSERVPDIVNIVLNEIGDTPVGFGTESFCKVSDVIERYNPNGYIKVMLKQTRQVDVMLSFEPQQLQFERLYCGRIPRTMLVVPWEQYTHFRDHYRELVRLFPAIG